MSENEPVDPKLDETVHEYLRAVEQGAAPSRDEWLRSHPDQAEALTQFFVDHDTVETVTSRLREAVTGEVKPFGDFDQLEEIGRGGMGVVLRARQKSLNRPVAIKMILAGAFADAKTRERFKGEAEAIAAMQHANIVQVHEVGEHEGKAYLCLEYLGGGSLKDKLDGTPWEGDKAAGLLATLARAMHYAHQHGIVHRDLKPGNILYAADETPKIADFGLARRLDELRESTDIVGTPSYMAPEQVTRNDLGPGIDVYALGAVLYELLTGRPPFTAATPHDVMNQIVSADPLAPRLLNPKLSRDLETICLACLRKEPARRYASALALAEDLERFLRQEPINARPISRVERAWRWCRRHPSRAIAWSVFFLALATVLTVVIAFNRRLRQEHRDLQAALTQQVTQRLNKQLEELTALPRTIAAGLALRRDWSEEQLETWMRQLLKGDERGFGITIAFEPDEFAKGVKDFALYVWRDPADGSFKKMQLVPPEYKPIYHEWTWYSRPRITGRPDWSEPFFDHGAGKVWMVTHSVPVLRDGKVAGIVTVDLQPDFFVKLRDLLAEANLGVKAHAFLLGPDGYFLTHSNPKWRLPVKLTEVADFDQRTFAPLLEASRDGKAGMLRARDPWTGNASTFFYAPAEVAGWLLVVAIEE